MLIDSVSSHLAASKNRDYQARVRSRFVVLTGFLDERGWLKEAALSRFAITPDEFDLFDDDLLGQGLAFITTSYDKWLKSLDRRKGPYSPEETRLRLDKLAGQFLSSK